MIVMSAETVTNAAIAATATMKTETGTETTMTKTRMKMTLDVIEGATETGIDPG